MKKLLVLVLLGVTAGLSAEGPYYAVWKCDGFSVAKGYLDEKSAYNDAGKSLEKTDIKYRITKGSHKIDPKFIDEVVINFCS